MAMNGSSIFDFVEILHETGLKMQMRESLPDIPTFGINSQRSLLSVVV